jgi:hypothetical protein
MKDFYKNLKKKEKQEVMTGGDVDGIFSFFRTLVKRKKVAKK